MALKVTWEHRVGFGKISCTTYRNSVLLFQNSCIDISNQNDSDGIYRGGEDELLKLFSVPLVSSQYLYLRTMAKASSPWNGRERLTPELYLEVPLKLAQDLGIGYGLA